MQLITLLVFTFFHLITGYGILRLFNIHLKPLMAGSLSVMLGIFVASVIPFLLQLLYIPLTSATIFSAWALVAVALNIKTLLHFKEMEWADTLKFNIKIYEWPFILFIAYILFVSAWRCYYMPPTPRDLLSGPEAIAQYAVKEHTFLNSVFTVNLETTNNQFKSPYLESLQLIYKLLGFPFGSVWLSMLVVSFFIFFYRGLTKIIHPILAGLLVLLFVSIPEAYGYTFMVLYDYSCMIFFFLGFYFLVAFFRQKERKLIYCSAFLFAVSVYIRSETLLFVVMLLPAIGLYGFRNKVKLSKLVLPAGILFVLSFLGYWIPIQLYNNHYLPQHYKLDNLINTHLFNLQPLWERLDEVNSKLIFGEWGQMLYGYIFYAFFILFIAELIVKRKFNLAARNWLYGALVIYSGLILLGFVFPLVDVNNGTKRGLFRIFPLLIFYLANNGLLQFVSEKISLWEQGKKPEVKLTGYPAGKSAGHAGKIKRKARQG
jgi:hypothetical protein